MKALFISDIFLRPMQSSWRLGYTIYMPITKTNYTPGQYEPSSVVETLFVDRVIRIETAVETRNFSDTFDYTDMRSVTATYALVWLGTHGVPPHTRHGRQKADATPSSWVATRDLEFHEQFAWVDCTNMFVDRNGYRLAVKLDGSHGLFGEPLMWANLVAWEAYHKAAAEKRAEELRIEQEARHAAEEAEKAKRAARHAKKVAKEATMKAETEKLLARIPAKGTIVTIDGFTGQIFWAGCSKYYGKWSARAGVKNAKGEVAWISADKF